MSPNEPKPATPEAQALLRAAGGDSKTVELLLQHRDAPVSSVCFHAQQYLEKVMKAVVVERLPKTRSGKILRGTMRNIADGESYKVPSTIDDPAILPEIEDAVGSIGYGSKARTS